MPTGSAPIISRQVLRINRLRPYENPDTMFGWRLGPKTPDGFWMVTRNRTAVGGGLQEWAVRVVIDPAATPIGLSREDLEDALYGRLDKRAEEDAYLASIEIVRMLPPDDLTRLREAVLAGKAGGSADGTAPKARRASRKAAAA